MLHEMLYYNCLQKHGLVVPLAKGAASSDRKTYRPITLTSCFALNGGANDFEPQPRVPVFAVGWMKVKLVSGGAVIFRHALVETLTLRKNCRTSCAQLDIRKAFNVAWHDAATCVEVTQGWNFRWHVVSD